MQTPKNTTISFGEFELDPLRRLLLKHDRPVVLKPKTLDLLLTFVQYHGEVLSKNDLMDKVWENQFVEENNLTVHIAALRKAFGETKSENRFIVTVPGVGYKFVAHFRPSQTTEVVVESHSFEQYSIEEEIESEAIEPQSRWPPGGRPATKTDEIPAGRSTLVRWLTRHRMAMALILSAVTLAGIGGYSARQRLFAGYYGNARFVQHRARQLTTNGNVGSAALSPDGKLFAYTVDDLGQKSLWLGYVDGGNQLQLRPPAEASYRSLTFAPDSSHLYFSLRDEKNPKYTLFKMPVLGGLQEKVLDDVGTFSLSPDGREIAHVRPFKDDDNRVNVSITPLDGSSGRDIVAFDKSQRFLSTTLSWTKDKTKLATALIADDKPSHTDIAVIDVATGSVETIRHEMLREITRTAWLSDGTGLIVTAVELNSYASVLQYRLFQIDYPSGKIHRITNDRSQYGASWHNDAGVSLGLSDASDALLSVEHRQVNNIWLARADDLTDRRQITFGSFGKYDGLWGLDWTPDGKLIYTTSDTESQFIAEINPDGSGQKQITAGGKVDSSLSVTADGKFIVFHSSRAPDFSIWRSDIDGSNTKQLTSGGDAFLPTPSPDGRWVYFKSTITPANGWLCRIPIDGGEQECFTEKETSFSSFSPDGKYIAAAYNTDKTRLAIFSAADHSIVRQIEIPKGATPSIGIKWKPDSRTFTVRDTSSGYWNFPIDGDPYKLTGLPAERLYNLSWSRDGKWLAFTRGQEVRDVVILQNTP